MQKPLDILVIDHNKADRTAIVFALTQTGLEMRITEASSYESAFVSLENVAYDCVFLDCCLLNQDSLGLVSQLRRDGVKVPLIALTSPDDEQLAIELIKAGASDYLSKSKASSDILSLVLRSAIRVYQAEVQAERANELLTRSNQELEAQRQQIQQQKIKLIEASQLKAKFLATISHELRTPLSSIIGFSQFLLRPKYGELNTLQQDMAKRILENGKHLLNLLNEVLDFSKLEAGKLNLKLQIFNLSTLIISVISELSHFAEVKKNQVQFIDKLQNSITYNDPLRVRQILINLLSNAIKFTNEGLIKIEVEEVNSHQIAITVTDTGIGIAPAEIEHIFEVFHQVDQTIARPYPGTGLGLAIVNALVLMMEGIISVESKVNEGSTFRVELPQQVSSNKQVAQNRAINPKKIAKSENVRKNSNSNFYLNPEYLYIQEIRNG
jgi:signal transduction histidine kinase